jgi:outer membrane protein
MKNISTFLSILSLILIAVLFYLHFTKKDTVKTVAAPMNKVQTGADFRIAYFDIDSLQTHFDYFKKVSTEMKARENAMTVELRSLENSYQKKIREWQEKGANMTQAEGEAAQREYAQMQQRYQKRQMDLEQDLQKQKVDLMTDLRKKVEDYLKEYNKDKGYAFILSYEPGFMLYYKDTLYDITSDLISGLNDKYKSKLKD